MHAKLTGRWRGLAAVPMDNGTRTQYPQTTATPGPSKFRMQFPHDMDRRTLKNRRISTIRLQYLKYAQGNCMRNYRDAVRTQHHATTSPQAWRAPEGPKGLATVPVNNGAWLRHPWGHKQQQARGTTPTGTHGGPAPRHSGRPELGNATRSSPSAPCAPGGASHPGQNGCGPRCVVPRLRCQ